MKKIALLAFHLFVIISVYFSQNEISFSVSGNIANTQFKEIELVKSDSNGIVSNMMKSELLTNGAFKFQGKLPSADYYYVRLNNQYIPLIIRSNSDIKIYGDGNKLDRFCNIVN
jgi:hypothetical protein